MDWITADRVTMVLVAMGYAIAGLRWLAPRTDWTVDDEVVAGINRAKAWAMRWAPTFWLVVEKLSKKGGNVQKAVEFARLIRAQYLKENGAELPLEAEAVAESVAAHLSADPDSIVFTPVPRPPVNPRPAPGDCPQ